MVVEGVGEVGRWSGTSGDLGLERGDFANVLFFLYVWVLYNSP